MSHFSHLPRDVQAYIFSFLAPNQVLDARRIDKRAQAAVDNEFSLIKLLFQKQLGVVLPNEVHIQQKYWQVYAEVSYVMSYVRLATVRRCVKEAYVDVENRSQQFSEMMEKLRNDGAMLERWLQSDNVAASIKAMRALSVTYDQTDTTAKQLALSHTVFRKLLTDDDQGELIIKMFSESYGINTKADEELRAAKLILLAIARCGAQVCLRLLCMKIKKHIPQFNCAGNDLFSDLMRESIKYGHSEFVRSLIELGMSGNESISTSDVDLSSGVTALTCVAASVKIYVRCVYPQVENARGVVRVGLETEFVKRMQTFNAITVMLIAANGKVDESAKLITVSSRASHDSVGLREHLHHHDNISPKSFAESVLKELLSLYNENKEQEDSPAFRIKVTVATKQALSLLTNPPTLQRQESAESETKRCKLTKGNGK